jgi:PAS domain S-box-containing protein
MLTSGSVLIGSYNYWEVALSILISVLSSHSALALTGRINDTQVWRRLTWFAGGGTAMGIGIWSMHYTAMMSFRLPVPVQYDWPTSLLSLIVAISASVGALIVVSRATMTARRAFVGSVFMGGAIVGMHYTGMASIRLPAMTHHSPWLVSLSVLIAIGFSWLALQLAFHFRDEVRGETLAKAASSLLMGAAISAMHYTGMAAVTFTFTGARSDLSHAVSISSLAMGGIGVVILTVLEICILISLLDRLRKQTALMNELFEQAPEAVALTTTGDQVTRVNKQFTRVFGYPMDEAVGHRLGELIVPENTRDEYKRRVAEAARGERVEAEAVGQRKDGSRLLISVVRVPV